MTQTPLIAVDVGNSRIKLGRFDSAGDRATAGRSQGLPNAALSLPQPGDTLSVPLSDRTGDFDAELLTAWVTQLPPPTRWLIASVHRGAADRLCQLLASLRSTADAYPVARVTPAQVPIPVNLPAPERVGVDRLLAAVAANRLRRPHQPAIVIDHGSAITVDLLDATGAFTGGAILPGMATSARALSEQTDALPHIAVESLDESVLPVGDSTVAALEAGLYWGTIGAVRQLVEEIAGRQSMSPEVFVTGGGAATLAGGLAKRTQLRIHHIPHLVLAAIALTTDADCQYT